MTRRRKRTRKRPARPQAAGRGSSRSEKTAEPDADGIPEGYGVEWDENFAFIAGFTSGGAPFGVTWDDV